MSEAETIKTLIRQMLAEGESLSHIQTRLKEQGHTMTFMELRMLAAELQDVQWGKPEKPAEPEGPSEPAPETAAEPAAEPAAEAPAAGKTVVEISRVVRPGAAAEGTVSFGSGASAVWIVDQMGRLGLEKVTGEYTENDIREFQQELARLFGR